MMYPLVGDLAADGIPVAVTCRVLGFSKQAYYAWRSRPVTDRDWDDAHLINAAIDIHHDDPEFGYRFIADELPARGIAAGRNRVHRLCSTARLFSAHSKKRGTARRPGPPVHDDLVERDFTADRPNRLWLTDITEHPTAEGKIYLCAIKDACTNRIVGYSIDNRMTSQLAVNALANAVALRRPAGTVVHSDRGSQGALNRSSQHLVMMEVSDGAAAAAGGSSVATGDALAGTAYPGPPCGARVLAADRRGQEHRAGVDRVGCVVARGVALVSSRWRDGAVAAGRADRPIPLVR